MSLRALGQQFAKVIEPIKKAKEELDRQHHEQMRLAPLDRNEHALRFED